MTEIGRLGIIGGSGWLGTAIARALMNSGTVTPHRLTCSYRSTKPEDALDCSWTKDNRQLVEQSDVVILSVRPADWAAIDVDASGKLLVSVMAGVTVDDLQRRTRSARVARAMPNAAAEIGYSYTPVFLTSPEPRDRDVVSLLFRSCGEVDLLPKEEHIDHFTAISGPGAAYPALLANALMTYAVGQGVPPDVARRAAQQVIVGAGRLQEHNGASPADTVKAFVDYDGTTAAAIRAMREHGFDDAVAAGLEAAFGKARALSGR